MALLGKRSSETPATIKVIDHLVLFKLKDGYTEEQENDMYKGLFSFKEYFPSVMAMSLGRVLSKNAENVTHALVMRFASKEALDIYMADDYRVEIAFKYIVPFFNGEIVADYETEVDTGLSELYREGEKFEGGLSHIEFFKVKEGTPAAALEDFLNTLAELPRKIQTEILQLTSGTNYKPNQKYTHALEARLPSVEALAALIQDPAYADFLGICYPLLDDHLRVDFLVDEAKKNIDKDFSR